MIEGAPVGVDPSEVHAAYDLVKRLDPFHPVRYTIRCMYRYGDRADGRAGGREGPLASASLFAVGVAWVGISAGTSG